MADSHEPGTGAPDASTLARNVQDIGANFADQAANDGVRAVFGAMDGGIDGAPPVINNLLGELGNLEGDTANLLGGLANQGVNRGFQETSPQLGAVGNFLGAAQGMAAQGMQFLDSPNINGRHFDLQYNQALNGYGQQQSSMLNQFGQARGNFVDASGQFVSDLSHGPGQAVDAIGQAGGAAVDAFDFTLDQVSRSMFNFGDQFSALGNHDFTRAVGADFSQQIVTGSGAVGGLASPYTASALNQSDFLNQSTSSLNRRLSRDLSRSQNSRPGSRQDDRRPTLSRSSSRPLSPGSTAAQNDNTTLRHGRMFNPDTNRHAEYVWVPKKTELGRNLVDRIMKHWNLKRPNLILKFDSGFAHPLHLLESAALADGVIGDKFQTLKGVVGKQETEKQQLAEVNKILNRLVYSIIRTIVQVASQQQIWVVVQGRPTGIIVLLEEALKECPNTTVLVIDSPGKKGNVDLGEKKRLYMKQLKKWPKSTPEQKTAREAKEQEITESLEKSIQLILDMNEELVRKSIQLDEEVKEQNVVQMQMDFWKDGTETKGWTQQSAGDAGTENVRWNQWIFRAGTHYVLMENDSSEQLDLTFFGPKGTVYLGGGGSTKQSIQDSMRLGEPTVLIHNTGRATQQLVLLHNKLIKCYNDPSKHEEVVGRPPDKQTEWIVELAEGCGLLGYEDKKVKFKSEVDMSDIVELDALYQQRSHIIEQTCVAIDPLDQDTSEQRVLKMVSDCFAANYRISTSVAYEAASRRAVATAWQLHAQLSSSCQWQKMAHDWSMHTVLLLGFMALIASVLLLEIERDGALAFGAETNGSFYDFLTYLVIILPTVSGLIGTLSSRMRFRETWGLMKSASCLIESEIFKFRVRVQEYAVVGSGKEGSDRSGRERQVRDHFMSKVEQIFQDYLADVSGAALRHTVDIGQVAGYAETAQVMSLQQQGGFESDALTKRAAMLSEMAVLKKFDEEADQPMEQPGAVSKDKLRNNAGTEVSMNPQLGNMAATKYYKDRCLPTLHTMTEDARDLQRWVTISEVLIGVSAVTASLLGALSKGSDGSTVALVPVCVTIGATVTSMMQQHALYGRLMAVNAAVRTLTRLDLDWNSSSALERCSLERITELVEETEFARLSVMAAWTCVASNAKDRDSVQGMEADKMQMNAQREGSAA